MIGNFILVAFPALVGGFPAMLWGEDRPIWATLSIAWLLGIALSAPILIAVGLCGIPYTGPNLLACYLLLITVLGLAWRYLRGHAKLERRSREHLSAASIVLLSLVLLNLCALACIAFKTPSIVWDVLEVWLPKAASLRPPGSMLGLSRPTYRDYPPLWPIHLGIVQAFATNAAVAKLLPTAYLACFLGLTYWYLSSRVGPVLAAGAVWVISGIPNLCYLIGVFDLLAEVPSMAFVCAATLLLAEYVDFGETRDGAASLILGAAAILVRPEGFLFGFEIAGLLCLAAIYKRNRGLVIACVAIPPGLYLSWHAAVKYVYHTDKAYLASFLAALKTISMGNGIIVGKYFLREFFDVYRFGPTLVEFVVIVAAWRAWKTWGLVATVFAAQVGTFFLVYLVLPSIGLPLDWLLYTSFDRMILHVVPLMPIAATLAFHRLFASPSGADSTGSKTKPAALKSHAPTPVVFTTLGILLLLAALVYAKSSQPGDVRLTTVAPNQTENIYGTISYGSDVGWWQSPEDTDAMMTHPVSNRKARVRYFLNNLGVRGTNKTIMGRFVRFESEVGLVKTRDTSKTIMGLFVRFETEVGLVKAHDGHVRFSVEIDGRKVAEVDRVVTGRDGRFPISADIPYNAKFIDLVVDPLGRNDFDHAVWFAPRLVPGGSLSAVACLLVLGGGTALCGAIIVSRRPKSQNGDQSWIGTIAIAAIVALVILILQADGVSNQLFRNWPS